MLPLGARGRRGLSPLRTFICQNPNCPRPGRRFEVRQSQIKTTRCHCSLQCRAQATWSTEFAAQLPSGAGRQRFVEARFWQKVRKTKSCWLWIGAKDNFGYGSFGGGAHGFPGTFRHTRAHRYAWILCRGPIPEGLCVLHNCPGGDNPACVNPDHLFLGTKAQNSEDMRRKGRNKRMHHKLTEEQASMIREVSALGLDQRRIAILAGVSDVTVRAILKRRTFKHVP